MLHNEGYVYAFPDSEIFGSSSQKVAETHRKPGERKADVIPSTLSLMLENDTY